MHIRLRRRCVYATFSLGFGGLRLSTVVTSLCVSLVCPGALWGSWVRRWRERYCVYCDCVWDPGALDSMVLGVEDAER